VFAFIGGGLIYAALRGYGLLKQQAALEEASPLSHGCGEPIGLRVARKA